MVDAIIVISVSFSLVCSLVTILFCLAVWIEKRGNKR